jgi:NAD+ diphosphatase
VVIMLVTDGAERLLLGRQAAWPTGRYSALAGFVEPGESLEEAVAREVREESAVRVGRPRYIASQPWPFPASLMLGFSAPHAGGEPDIRDAELQDVRWFSRAEIAAAAAEDDDAQWGTPGDAGGELRLPPRLAIARHLVEDWLSSPA